MTNTIHALWRRILVQLISMKRKESKPKLKTEKKNISRSLVIHKLVASCCTYLFAKYPEVDKLTKFNEGFYVIFE